MEAFISSMMASGPDAKRPPHIWLEVFVSEAPSAIAVSVLKKVQVLKTDMTDPGKPRSALRLVALAALLGLIAGAAAVYVRQSGSGNAPEIASAGASGQCAAASGKIASLTPL